MSDYTTAWAVSSGSYSDYHVHALFETEAQAELHAAELAETGEVWGSPEVEKFPYFTADQKVSFVTLYTASASKAAPEAKITYSRRLPEYDAWEAHEVRKRPRVYHHQTLSEGKKVWAVSARALDPEQAIKACADNVTAKQLKDVGLT